MIYSMMVSGYCGQSTFPFFKALKTLQKLRFDILLNIENVKIEIASQHFLFSI